ncbi:MAG TPA: efflux RND transporter periplasmic adaptor subunit [Candidatus Binataceae bacterium]|nr:efflux RND transporter periplasmic adaptor subunit [Candidatus Binataceae bacterium]
MSIAQWRNAAWEKRYELLIGLVLGVVVFFELARLVVYLVHSDGSKARIVGLPIPVQILPVSFHQLHESIGASGAIEPSVYTIVTAKVNGRVLDVPVDLGHMVKPGSLLVRVDDTLYRARLKFANESYEHAAHQLERIERLYKDQLASIVQLEAAQASKAQAYQTLVSAQINLANTTIRSPADAVVLERAINPGQFTHTDQVLIELGIIQPAMMVVGVDEDKLGSVYMGMSAVVGMDAYPGESFTGEVTKIGAEVSPVTRTFNVFVKMSNRDWRLKPGLTGYVRLDSTRNVLAVPSVALMNPVGDRVSAFIVDDKRKVHLREVRRGLIADGYTELLDGVKPGEQIVTVGQLQLRDNDVISENHFGPWNAANRGARRPGMLARYWSTLWHQNNSPSLAHQ